MTAALYDPRSNIWTPITTTGAPSPRLFFASAWDSVNLFVWGGVDSRFRPLPDGALYNTKTGAWRTISRTDAPHAKTRPQRRLVGKRIPRLGRL